MNWKPYEPALHRIEGWGAALFNLYLLVIRREFKQLPPENDKYPIMYVIRTAGGLFMLCASAADLHNDGWNDDDSVTITEYWAKPRVMDTLGDLWDNHIGYTIAWFSVLGAGIAIGKWLL